MTLRNVNQKPKLMEVWTRRSSWLGSGSHVGYIQVYEEVHTRGFVLY